MFDFSFGEMAVVGVVALVVLGPEKLPKVARTVGRWVGRARRYMHDLSTELERETQASELRRQLRDVQTAMRDTQQQLSRDVEHTRAEVDRMLPPSIVAAAPPPDGGSAAASPPTPESRP